MLHRRLLILWMVIAASTSAFAGDTLEQYAKKCDEAIGVTVPDFNCDRGTIVPTEHHTNPDGSPAKYQPKRACDRPNQLNQECDPKSRFQVLTNDANAYVVAHCRKQGLKDGEYGDIAVIQHNKDNGATCFYQALANWENQETGRGKGGQATFLSGSQTSFQSLIDIPRFAGGPKGAAHGNGAKLQRSTLDCLLWMSDYAFDVIQAPLTKPRFLVNCASQKLKGMSVIFTTFPCLSPHNGGITYHHASHPAWTTRRSRFPCDESWQ